MNVFVTETALARLRQIWPEGKVLRIIGELIGGCGMTVEYSLVWDERSAQDILVEQDGLVIVTDAETVAFIAEPTLTIDYRENQGYRLVTPAQFIAYGLHVKERWS